MASGRWQGAEDQRSDVGGLRTEECVGLGVCGFWGVRLLTFLLTADPPEADDSTKVKVPA